MKTWIHKCTGDVDISQVKRRRPNPSMPSSKKNYWRQIHNPKNLEFAKAKPNAKTDYLIGTVVPTIIYDCSR